jgi:hypothetical protein
VITLLETFLVLGFQVTGAAALHRCLSLVTQTEIGPGVAEGIGSANIGTSAVAFAAKPIADSFKKLRRELSIYRTSNKNAMNLRE